MRCEDYPCCGCGPEGCVDKTRKVQCKQCGATYHPDQNTETYCYRCQIPRDEYGEMIDDPNDNY